MISLLLRRQRERSGLSLAEAAERLGAMLKKQPIESLQLD
jgi:cytoskeletal protein RodZ